MSVAAEYLQLFDEYSKKYGAKTAVLMCVGSFFEAYGIDNEKEKRGNAVELSSILNMVLTRKNKKIAENSISNPLMLGFPCVALQKYIPILLEENYTIVVVEQIKTNLSIRRVVADVISPSTYIDGRDDDNFLCLIYADQIAIGISAISVLTGRSIVHECYAKSGDASVSVDDAVSFLKQYRPREIVVTGVEIPELASYLDEGILCHRAEVKKVAKNVQYQDAVLGNLFENKTMLSNIEYVDLERKPYALTSYVLLTEFVYNHNPMLLKKLSLPEVFLPCDHLVLAANTIDQLNVLPRRKSKSKDNLFSVINRCSTSVGKRLLRQRLASPIFDADRLERRYQHIEDFGKVFGDRLPEIEKILGNIVDIERLQRRVCLGVINPNEFCSLQTSYRSLVELNDTLTAAECLPSITLNDDEYALLNDFVDICDSVFEFDSMTSCDIEDIAARVFKRGVFEKIDAAYDELHAETDKMEKLAQTLSAGSGSVKVCYMQNVGYYLSTSNSYAKRMQKDADLVLRSNKTTTRITSRDIDAASSKLTVLNERLKARSKQCYLKVLNRLSSCYGSMFHRLASFLAEVDVVKSNHKTSIMHDYCKPTIVRDTESFIDAKGLRHPIIERIDNGTEYVSNDVNIGMEHNGIVLYSMNACGKTSLLKACGTSVVLAQAGCFVPASRYEFHPFRCLMTRILSEDNIMKGQSSFVAEMSELRAILKRAEDAFTLVLADEITHGTEHTSGSSIFVASVETLASRNVNFVFTTHLHNVYPFVRNVKNVRVFHLSVSFDDDRITFERKLADGPGSSIYGLEVCEFLNMDTGFLARAFQIRNVITPDKTEKTSAIKTSRYNRSKIVQQCEICAYSPKALTDMPLDVHHIKHQSIADCNDIIEGVHKDAKCNLVALCKQCHVKVHKNQIEIFGYKQTTKGLKLVFDDF